jgi:hypothetical protein
MKTLHAFLLLIFFIVVNSNYTYADQKTAHFLTSPDANNIRLLHTWYVGETMSTELKALVRENKDGGYRLEIYRIGNGQPKKLYDHEGSLPGSISQLDDKLVVLWGSAVGFILNVFEYKDGKIKMVIDDGSYLPPEFVYIGKDLKSAFLIAKLEWVKNANGDSEKIPTKANVYIFSNKEIIIKKDVPWGKRYDSAEIMK